MSRLLHQIEDAINLVRVGAPPCVGPSSELALVLDGHWRPDALIVIIKVFLDESDSHKEAPTLFMGGYVANVAQWNYFDQGWSKMLGKYGLDHFHTADFWAETGAYRHRSDDWNVGLTERIQKLARRPMFGFTVELNRAEFAEHYRGAAPARKPRLDNEYGLAFRCCMSFLPQYVAAATGRDDCRIHIILENSQHFGEALRVYDELRAGVPEMERRYTSMTPGTKRQYPGLQAADALITSFRRHRDQLDFSEKLKNPPANVITARAKTVMRTPLYRVFMDAEAMRDIKGALIELPAKKRQAWLESKP